MNPNDYYRMKSAEIKESDIRLVAAVMSEHVGEENAVRMEKLVARCGLGERQAGSSRTNRNAGTWRTSC